MSSQALAGGLRPALPPTLQPMAIALAAPRTDKRVALLGSAVAYLLIPAALLALGRVAPKVIQASTGTDHTVVLVETPASGGGPAPAGAPTPSRPLPPSDSALPLPAAIPAVDTGDHPAPLEALVDRSGPGLATSDRPGAPTGPTGPALPAGPGTGSPGVGPVVQISADAVRIVHQEVPVYPTLARAGRIQGDVVVRMVIDPQGVPTSVHVEQGHPALRAAAEQAARAWRFTAAQVNGQAVSASFLLTLKFRLQ